MSTKAKITGRWKTICTVGYTCGVARDENRAAHGGVCHCQVRRDRNGNLIGRKVNTNGRHTEEGESFELSEEMLAHWERVARS